MGDEPASTHDIPVKIPELKSPLAITAGEPAGIGPELCLALAHSDWAQHVVIITDPDVLVHRAAQLGTNISIVEFDPTEPGRVEIPAASLRVWPHNMPVPDVCGTPDPANAEALLLGLRMATNACQKEVFCALVTAPLQKSTINEGGIEFSGHTEYLAELTETEMPVMLLVGGDLRVALASTHMPLSEVPSYITTKRLEKVIEVLHRDLQSRFGIDDPQIVVCGLNPHAGESGHLGREDQDLIAPVVDAFREKGWSLRGPLPADTAFTPAAGHADAVLALC